MFDYFKLKVDRYPTNRKPFGKALKRVTGCYHYISKCSTVLWFKCSKHMLPVYYQWLLSLWISPSFQFTTANFQFTTAMWCISFIEIGIFHLCFDFLNSFLIFFFKVGRNPTMQQETIQKGIETSYMLLPLNKKTF